MVNTGLSLDELVVVRDSVRNIRRKIMMGSTIFDNTQNKANFSRIAGRTDRKTYNDEGFV